MFTRPIRDLRYQSADILRRLQADKDKTVLLISRSVPCVYLQLCTPAEAEWAMETGALSFSFREVCRTVPMLQQLRSQPDPSRHGVFRVGALSPRPVLWGFVSLASAEDVQAAQELHVS